VNVAANGEWRGNSMTKIRTGEVWPVAQMAAVGRGNVRVPASTGWTHVQFRRFVGCPICALHLRQFVRRKAELDTRGIAEVVVFASSEAALAEYAAEFPFALVADPARELYRRSAWALAHPKSWLAGIRGLVTAGAAMPERVADAQGTPADFLIDARGIVRAGKYGRHADDQWSVEEVMGMV
jgi:peroxiredoxin